MSRRSLARLLARLCSIAIVVLLGLSATGWWVLRSSMPQYEGVVESTGLQAPVVVERDALGSATLRAGNRTDAAWALG